MGSITAQARESYLPVSVCWTKDPFVLPERANTFMTSQQRRDARYNERVREQSKSPQERQREICDDYNPCERYAMRHGFSAAYRRYFGNRRVGK